MAGHKDERGINLKCYLGRFCFYFFFYTDEWLSDWINGCPNKGMPGGVPKIINETLLINYSQAPMILVMEPNLNYEAIHKHKGKNINA